MGVNLLAGLAGEVGNLEAGPVVARGGATQLDVGGPVSRAARVVRAPAGIVEHAPAEMTVRVLAGTTVAELDAALAERGQCVALPDHPGSTVGGVLSVGRSGIRRLGWGPVRDTVLEVRYVSAEGKVVKGGGPTVKNVSGYDLPRLLVGSLGTLGVIGEVVLRTRPVPACEQWHAARERTNPFALQRALHRPASVLWDGTSTWVLLDGHPRDVEDEARSHGLTPCAQSALPALPRHRWSLAPSALAALPRDRNGAFVAEVGVGVVHRTIEQPPRRMAPALQALQRRIKDAFDPTGRLAPGRVLA